MTSIRGYDCSTLLSLAPPAIAGAIRLVSTIERRVAVAITEHNGIVLSVEDLLPALADVFAAATRLLHSDPRHPLRAPILHVLDLAHELVDIVGLELSWWSS